MSDTVTFYAWSDIRHGTPKGAVKVIKAGSTVSPKDLDNDEAEFSALVDCRAIRTTVFPTMPNTFQGSPMEFIKEKIRKANEGEDPEMVTYAMITDPTYRDAMQGAEMKLPELPEEVEEAEGTIADKKD